MASLRMTQFLIALLLSQLVACGGIPVQAVACAHGTSQSTVQTTPSAAICCDHASEHVVCQHCEACSGQNVQQPNTFPLLA